MEGVARGSVRSADVVDGRGLEGFRLFGLSFRLEP